MLVYQRLAGLDFATYALSSDRICHHALYFILERSEFVVLEAHTALA
jgi:hypothetical protein